VRPADAVQPKGPTVPAVPPTAESVPAPIENRPAEASTDTRANREPPPALKTAAVEAPTTEPNPGAGPDPLSADGRGLRPHETRADRPAESSSAGRDRETAGVNRSGVFDQIVQRAVLQVRNDQSEIKIDLKPDFLGNVRMQIVAEQQQVSVRIVTDTPVVRDMIETGLQQLRSDLQNQGLQVDRIEVSVSDGYRDPRQRQGWDGEPSKGERAEGIDTAARTGAAERSEPMAYRSVGSARRSNVDMFV
jgi:flagellar hook-length control protein FliK